MYNLMIVSNSWSKELSEHYFHMFMFCLRGVFTSLRVYCLRVSVFSCFLVFVVCLLSQNKCAGLQSGFWHPLRPRRKTATAIVGAGRARLPARARVGFGGGAGLGGGAGW